MNIEELAIEENKLYESVIEIYNDKSSVENDFKLNEIFIKYKDIHKLYADIAEENIEALKRGLFIQWYSKVEPNYLSGIRDVDLISEVKILKIIEKIIPILDIEFKWMLNHYGNGEFAIETKGNLPRLEKYIKNITDVNFPKIINREEMAKRGQMGIYWNSLNVFNK